MKEKWKIFTILFLKYSRISWNKTQLSEMAGITTNAMAKLGKNESVQLETLAKICKVLECNIEDVAEIKKEGGTI